MIPFVRVYPLPKEAVSYGDGWMGAPLHDSMRCDFCGVYVAGSTKAALDSARTNHRETCQGAK